MTEYEAIERLEQLTRRACNLEALGVLQDLFGEDCDDLLVRSYLGLFMVTERGQVRQGIEMCQNSVEKLGDVPETFINLGRAYLRAGEKRAAIEVLRRGIGRHQRDPEIDRMLCDLGIRRPPIFRSLPRDHPLNKFGGKLASRLGLR